MGTGNTLKIITIALIVVALMSLTAFATYGEPLIESEVPTSSYQE